MRYIIKAVSRNAAQADKFSECGYAAHGETPLEEPVRSAEQHQRHQGPQLGELS